ncbi:MAG: SH3 domain-containing protein, partial [Lysinibacillus sp.]
MKKWLAFAILLLSLLIAPVASEASSAPTVKKATATVQVKSDASASAKNVLKLSKGSLVIVTGEKNNFSKVSYKGKTGYVATASLVTAASTPKSVSRAKGLVIKAVPASSAKTVTTLQAKTIVEDYGKVDKTYHLVQYGSVIGYAHHSAIKATKPVTRYITGDLVQLYASANTKGVKRGKLTFSNAVKVHGTVGSWSYVTAGNKKGYIAKSFLAVKKPVQLKGTKVNFAEIKPDVRFTTTLTDL